MHVPSLPMGAESKPIGEIEILEARQSAHSNLFVKLYREALFAPYKKKDDDNMVTITEVFRVAIDHQLLRVVKARCLQQVIRQDGVGNDNLAVQAL